MAYGFFERVKAFITSPSKAFDKEHKTSLKGAMIYSLKGLLIFATVFTVVFGLLGTITQGIGPVMIPIIFFALLFGLFLGLLLTSLWYHLWAYVFGARQGYKNTVKAALFGYTPTYILGWIPVINYVTGIWSLVLLGIGLKKYQKLSTGRAIATIVVAVVIPLIIAIILVAWMFLTYGTQLLASNQQTTLPFSFPY